VLLDLGLPNAQQWAAGWTCCAAARAQGRDAVIVPHARDALGDRVPGGRRADDYLVKRSNSTN